MHDAKRNEHRRRTRSSYRPASNRWFALGLLSLAWCGSWYGSWRGSPALAQEAPTPSTLEQFQYEALGTTVTLEADRTRSIVRTRIADGVAGLDEIDAIILEVAQSLPALSSEAAKGDSSGILPPVATFADAPRTYYLDFDPRTPVDQQQQFLDLVHDRPEVEWASLGLRYGTSLLAARAQLCVVAETNRIDVARNSLIARGYSIVRTFEALPHVWVASFDGRPSESFARVRQVAAIEGVSSAQPILFGRINPHFDPNDPLFDVQWAHQNSGQLGAGTVPGADINSSNAWNISTGSSAIRIAILDDGVDGSHPDLTPNMNPGYDATDEPPPGGIPGHPRPEDSHGTSCAGIAGAVGNDGQGMVGVAWNCRLVPVRVGYGLLFTQTDWVIDAITWAADNADVLSCSWGGLPPGGGEVSALDYATVTARGGLGCAVVFSAGNGTEVEYPAAYDATIAVGATSPCDERKSVVSCDGEDWWSSATGPEIDLVAPGVWVTTTDNYGPAGASLDDYVFDFNGTSAACPHVAGALALLLSLDPVIASSELRARLHDTASDQVGPSTEDVPGPDDYMGHGRLNVWELLTTAVDLLPPFDLQCARVGDSAQVTWENGTDYVAVIVERDGAILAVMPGTVTSFTDGSPPAGDVEYRVRGAQVGGVTTSGAACSLFFLGELTDLVWSPTSGMGPGDSGAEIVAALELAGRSPLLVTDLFAAPPLSDFETVWVCLGVFPNNHPLSDLEAAVLVDHLTTSSQASMYLEGGDVWFLDAPSELRSLFGIASFDDGADDLDAMIGTGTGNCDLSPFTLSYEGANQSIDRLAPLPASDSTAVLLNETPIYATAIFHQENSYRTLGVSHEFGGLQLGTFSRRELISAYLLCFLGDELSPTLSAGGVSAGPGETGTQGIRASTHLSLSGYSFGMTFDPTLVAVTEVTLAGTDAEGAQVVLPNIDNAAGYWTVGVVMDLTPPVVPLPPGYEFEVARARYVVDSAAPIGLTIPLSIPESVGDPAVEAIFSSPTGATVSPARIPGLFKVRQPTMTVRADDGVVTPGEEYFHTTRGSYHEDLSAYTIGLEVDTTHINISAVDLIDTDAFDADYFEPVVGLGGAWATAKVLVDAITPIDDLLPAAIGSPLLRTTLQIGPDMQPGDTALVSLPPTVGFPPLVTSFVTPSGTLHMPQRIPGELAVPGGALFIRGDANVSGDLPNIADSVAILEGLFGDLTLDCLDAADVNDDGAVDIGDAVYGLSALFTAGPEPVAPFPTPGLDPTPDGLGCDQPIQPTPFGL